MNGGGSLEAAKVKCAKETKCRGFYKSRSYHSCMGPVREESSTHGSILYVKGKIIVFIIQGLIQDFHCF